MKAATDNAEELIKILTRQANRARQDEITTEIMRDRRRGRGPVRGIRGVSEHGRRQTNGHANGRVVRVIGPVVDVEFPPGELPEINTALTVDVALGGETTTITCEVAQHIGDSPGARDRAEADRRPGARRPGRQHRRADHGAGGRGRARPRVQRAGRAARHDRGPDPRRRPLADPPRAARRSTSSSRSP